MASDHGSGNMKRVIIALALTGCFMIVEVIGTTDPWEKVLAAF